MVAHPKKREQRSLLNFSHISSSGTKGMITDTLSTHEGGGSIEERDTYKKGKPNGSARINSNKILPCSFQVHGLLRLGGRREQQWLFVFSNFMSITLTCFLTSLVSEK